MAAAGPQPEGLVISGRYHVQRTLGSGSMGTVYLVRDESLGALVALKLIRSERLDPEVLDDLQREFRAIASLHHPQIATAHDFGYTEDRRLPFYTREYIEGVPLAPGRSSRPSTACATRRLRFSWWGRRARGRSWWRRPSTRPARGEAAPSRRSTAPRFRASSSSRSFSGTRPVRSRGRKTRIRVSWSTSRAELCFSTRSRAFL